MIQRESDRRESQSMYRLVLIAAVFALVVSSDVEGQPISEAYLKASNTDSEDRFGWAAAVSGDTLVVGAYHEDGAGAGVNSPLQADNSLSNAGAAYVFRRAGGTWAQEAYLKASNPGSGDSFGWSVAIDGDTIVVGAVGEESNSVGVNGDQTDDSTPSGAVYVFQRVAGSWQQQAYLKASNTGLGDRFGYSVALSGDTVIVGADGEDGNGFDQSSNALSSSGAAYVFHRTGLTWSQEAYLKGSSVSNPWIDNHFGFSVDVDGNTAVVGARWQDSQQVDSGAAYVFVRDSTTQIWTQQAFLKGTGIDAADFFGHSVAISCDTIVIGAYGEDSSASGVDGDQQDDSMPGCGAAYVFVRNPLTQSWESEAYLKPSAPLANTVFGWSTAISGDTILVGRRSGFERAYVFRRAAGAWSAGPDLTAVNSETGDVFGAVLGVSGDRAILGAYGEQSNAAGVDGDETDNSLSEAGAAYVFDLDLSAWEDQLCGLAGASGVPALHGSGSLLAGTDYTVSLCGAASGAIAGLFVSTSSTPVPFKGGVLKPFPPLIAGQLATTSLAGTIGLAGTMPAGFPSGTEIWIQWAIQDSGAPKGVALSNSLMGVAP
jgi:hypothetical protein